LSVFSGSAALPSIAATVASTDLPAVEIGDLLLSLLEKSLMHADRVGRERRFRLVESTRYSRSRAT
jgi:hypothetical protein